ncbi:DNA-packaging protein [Priestia megaterium]|uniref:head-tail connector protein n=1 Tax=Priestia megaterium TaxID=1404 RepID=UPI000BEC4770|nr:head-tail connector protein [Priestia megaterium]MED3972254.1 head-tail connector protein [Priestia megaterium]PEB63310.1 DNA-packaging protein [Priestia megaterium]
MIEKVRKTLRISHTALDDDIQDLIDAALMELQLSGVKKLDEDDPLIIRAVKVYCKAEFGFDNPDAERFRESFEALRTHLSLAGDYNAIS